MNKTGRPLTPIDFGIVFDLAKIHCTVSEIAAILDVPESTIAASNDFQETYKKGMEQGRKSLRRLQFQKAEGQDAKILKDEEGKPILDDKRRPIILQPGYAPDTTMQIWLGKQQLGQTDTQNIRINDEKPVEVIIKNYEKENKG